MKIEIHLLQNFAPSCLNRDDTNTPKECDFGGVRRARISSQCFKRAIRQHFKQTNAIPSGDRTKELARVLAERVPDAAPATVKAVLAALAKMDTKNPEYTSVLIFAGPGEIEALAECVRENVTDAKEVQKAVKAARTSPDVALFGRMLAEAPDNNIDAACQVGHAISTHAAALEMDFFTAVDDLNTRDDVGAGMLGYTGFQSACLYRYALLDVDQLKNNLSGDPESTKKAVEALLWAFCDAEPSARQNSMPAHNRPSLGLFVARDKGVPTSLANAFCKPVSVRSGEPDLIGASVQALASYHKKLGEVYEAFDGATQAVFSDGSGNLGEILAPFDAGSQRKAIQAILEAL
jgi:CRISPR system Cascade subunit CasC